MSSLNIDEFATDGVDGRIGDAMGSARGDAGVRMESILQIPVVLQVVVGSTTLPVADLLKLDRGAVIPLDSRVGDPVEVMINGREIARGEVVVVEDDHTRFSVSLTEIREPHLGQEHE